MRVTYPATLSICKLTDEEKVTSEYLFTLNKKVCKAKLKTACNKISASMYNRVFFEECRSKLDIVRRYQVNSLAEAQRLFQEYKEKHNIVD
jgi:hypothetical protein